jgi:hypothetical protein
VISILIPSRNERFLYHTVLDALSKAAGEVEVLALLDGYWPDPPLPEHPRLRVYHTGNPRGMRAMINAGAAIAKGDYLLKSDGHCMFAEGFDEVLKANMADNWIVIPRRHRLDAENWTLQETNKPPIDYHYLSCPLTNLDGYSMHGAIWPERTRERTDLLIDETMSFQGSLWMMSRKHWDWLGGMSEEGYGTFSQEPQEIGNKTWLGGGRIVVNKKTWYAHLHKGKQYGRMYSISGAAVKAGHEYSAHYWMQNRWKERVRDMEWLIDKFWPVPTWPDNWKGLLDDYRRNIAR